MSKHSGHAALSLHGYHYEGLKVLAKELGRPVSTLIALSPGNDPFYIGPARQEAATWFGRLWQDILRGDDVHVRRLHYKLISQDRPILKVDGTPFENTEDDWNRLVNCSRDARHLDLVPADHFVDRRADEPLILLDDPTDESNTIEVVAADALEALNVRMPLPPRLVHAFEPPVIAQRYHIETWCEKTTANDILERLARRFSLNVVTGSGELSLTACLGVVDRALRSRRPVRVIYVTDFDPGGQSMPVAVARKIEHLLYQRGLEDELDIQVRHVALTHAQCERYRLPRTPMKATEKRAARFEERYGEGATELDALEALHAGELERILTREILRYYDQDLDDRVDEVAQVAEEEMAREIERINQAVLDNHADELRRLRHDFRAINVEINGWKRRANVTWRAIATELAAEAPEPPEVEWPEPDEGDEDLDPLFDSTRDYIEQIDRYKQHQDKPTTGNQLEVVCQLCSETFTAQRSTARVCPDCRPKLRRPENAHLRTSR